VATLLNGVNEVLKRVRFIQGDGGLLTSLTDEARQSAVDVAVQVWNEAIEELYSMASVPLPKELAENTITLVTSDRDYTLQTDLIQLHWPFHDETNGRFITEYPGGYLALKRDQLVPANESGQPYFGAIRPTDGLLYLDKLPTATENGQVYTYNYDKDISLSAAADVFPFSDAVYRAMVAATAQYWQRDWQRDWDNDIFQTNLGRAARLLTQQQQHTNWLPRRKSGGNSPRI
jgi:hypothetical protein